MPSGKWCAGATTASFAWGSAASRARRRNPARRWRPASRVCRRAPGHRACRQNPAPRSRPRRRDRAPPGQQRQALAHARRDHDRLGRAGKAAGHAEIGGDSGAQAGVPEGMRAPRPSRTAVAIRAPAAAPTARRGRPRGRAVRSERQAGPPRVATGRHGVAHCRTGAARQEGGGGAVAGRRGRRAARVARSTSRPADRWRRRGRIRLGHDVAFGDQLVHGQQHGAARDIELPAMRREEGRRYRAPAASRGWRGAPARRSGDAAAERAGTRTRPKGAALRRGRGMTGIVRIVETGSFVCTLT